MYVQGTTGNFFEKNNSIQNFLRHHKHARVVKFSITQWNILGALPLNFGPKGSFTPPFFTEGGRFHRYLLIGQGAVFGPKAGI